MALREQPMVMPAIPAGAMAVAAAVVWEVMAAALEVQAGRAAMWVVLVAPAVPEATAA